MMHNNVAFSDWMLFFVLNELPKAAKSAKYIFWYFL